MGEPSALDGECHSADAVPLEICRLLALRNDDLHRCMQAIPQFACNLMELTCGRMRASSQITEILAIKDLSHRVAYLLLILASRYDRNKSGPIRIPLRLAQIDLAEWMGTSRPRVNRVLAQLRKENLIALERDYRITVLDPRALA